MVNVRKAITIMVSVALGLVVVVIGLGMLPFYLAMPWDVFNVYMWIVAPLTLLWASDKQNKENQREAVASKPCLRIEVVESSVNTPDGETKEVKKIIDEKRFIELYGECDLNMLKHNGSVGDVIGQGRWYRAKLLQP